MKDKILATLMLCAFAVFVGLGAADAFFGVSTLFGVATIKIGVGMLVVMIFGTFLWALWQIWKWR